MPCISLGCKSINALVRNGASRYRRCDLNATDPAEPIHDEEFWREGRGPELRRVLWNASGTSVRAIEYFNPDWSDADSDLRHVRFVAPQVVQITPEEIIGPAQTGTRYLDHRRAAMFDLGRSGWLESFAQTHLENCRHLQMLFNDELIDIICEGAAFGVGPADASDAIL